MREQLEKRLEELRGEFEKGKATLQELEAKTASVREMMLRLSGAIQVLEELLAQGATTPDGAAIPAGGS